MPHRTSRRQRARGVPSSPALLARVRCWLIGSTCRPVASASGCRHEQTGYPSAAILTSPPRDRPRPVSMCPGAMAFTPASSHAWRSPAMIDSGGEIHVEGKSHTRRSHAHRCIPTHTVASQPSRAIPLCAADRSIRRDFGRAQDGPGIALLARNRRSCELCRIKSSAALSIVC
jgi:hypothetical protein